MLKTKILLLAILTYIIALPLRSQSTHSSTSDDYKSIATDSLDNTGMTTYNYFPNSSRNNDSIQNNLELDPKASTIPSKEYSVVTKKDDDMLNKFDHCPKAPSLSSIHERPVVSPEEYEILDSAIQNLNFNTSKSSICPSSLPCLNELAQLLANKPSWRLRIAGQVDNHQFESFNLELSKNRAEAIMFYLMSKNVPQHQLITEYFGEIQALDRNAHKSQKESGIVMEFVFE